MTNTTTRHATRMRVTKRNGELEEVKFDEISRRLKELTEDLDIDPIRIATLVCSRLVDKIKTSDLDDLSAHLCSSLVIENSDFETLGIRILMSSHEKETCYEYSDVADLLQQNLDSEGELAPILHSEFYSFIDENRQEVDEHFCWMTRKYNLFAMSIFGWRTLYRSYLLKSNRKVVERPEHLFYRIALFFYRNQWEKVEETFAGMMQGKFIHATPTLYHAGTTRPQMSSCFLLNTGDSIEEIFKTLSDTAMISKWAGGVGLSISNVRCKNSYIRGTNGHSNGIMPMMKVFNDTSRYIDQGGGKRKGSFALYAEPWHGDIFDFIYAKRNIGNEEERARDLFYGLWIPDLFMKRVEENAKWSLMCPNRCPMLVDTYGEEFEKWYTKYEQEGTYMRQIEARELWKEIIHSQIETGLPYMLYKDSCNMKSNQKNLGTIRNSNLCVSGDTMILTENGYYPIEDLQNQHVRVWNGSEFSDVIVSQTGEDQKLVDVELDNGITLKCTPYHKFYVNGHDNSVIAQDLKGGMEIINFNVPLLNMKRSLESSYDLGFNSDHNFVPINYNLKSRIQWLQGFFDKTKMGTDHLLSSHNKNFITNIYLMIQTLGIKTSVSFQNNLYTLNLSLKNISDLEDLGFDDRNIFKYREPNNHNDIIAIKSVKDNNEYGDTFCFNEPKKHMGIFNGILTGQCCEIIQYSRTEETAVCNLASINLSNSISKNPNIELLQDCVIYTTATCVYCKLLKSELTKYNIKYTEKDPSDLGKEAIKTVPQLFLNDTTHVGGYTEVYDKYIQPQFDFKELQTRVFRLVENMNVVINRNYYPTPECQKSNMSHRPIGIGVQGLADLFCKLRLAFDCEKARYLNVKIFETIYFSALTASNNLVKDFGCYSSFHGSPLSEGKFHFEHCSNFDETILEQEPKYDWTSLRKNIMEHGVCNSLLLAPMPTASTSQILNQNECIEPFTSNLYVRRTLAGEFTIFNKYLMDDLKALNLWNQDTIDYLIVNRGSVVNFAQLPVFMRKMYRTAWEIPQKSLIEMASQRQWFIDQSQSFNLFVADPSFDKLTKMHFYGWKNGLKTGSYYVRTKPQHFSQNFTIDANKDKECSSCSA